MAMKLNAVEKANDSTIRAFNKQIENAFRKLGYNHTVTQNLINKAKSVYGVSALKGMKITAGYTIGQINPETGEIFEIPQIQRNRKTVSDTLKAKALKSAVQYTTGTKKGQYKNMYDVTAAHQKAIKQVQQSILKATPNAEIMAYNAAKSRLLGMQGTPAANTKEYNTLMKQVKEFERKQKKPLTQSRVRRQLIENDLSSEIFAAYEQAKEDGDDVTLYQDFAKEYHSGNDFDYDLLKQINQRRYDVLMKKSQNPEYYQSGLNSSALNEFLLNLDDFEEIYNPFE